MPTLAFKVDKLQLPKAWNDAIGIQDGATSSLNLVLDVNNPILGVSIVGQKTALNPNGIALKPFTIVKTVAGKAVPASLPDSVQVRTAQLLFAPLGGTDATGHAINPVRRWCSTAPSPGSVHVDANVAVLPYPTLTADAAVGNFAVGPVTLNNTDLKINLSADPKNPTADFSFHGGFTDKYSGISFLAGIDEGASASMANAAVSLHIAGGQPQYLQAGADLVGSVSVNGNGASFLRLRHRVGHRRRQNLGSVPFSYSTTSGALWQQLQAAPARSRRRSRMRTAGPTRRARRRVEHPAGHPGADRRSPAVGLRRRVRHGDAGAAEHRVQRRHRDLDREVRARRRRQPGRVHAVPAGVPADPDHQPAGALLR